MFPVLLLALVLLLCLVVLAPLCVDCYQRPMRSISQTHTSEDTYIPPTQFRIHRPGQVSIEANYSHPLSNHLSPHVSVARPSCPSFTESESNNSYENESVSPPDSERALDIVDPGYIVVIPETEVDNDSRPSSPTLEHEYVNVKRLSDSSDYENLHTELQSSDSDDDDDDDDDDDEEGNYVNQPPKAD